MKKLLNIITITIISLFSYYYTDKLIDLSKRNDPIMKEIINNKSNYEVSPINGIIDNDTLSVGVSGKVVNIDKSFEKMKSFNKYSDIFFEYTTISPKIKKKNNYDKYIIGSLSNDNEISFIFKSNNISLIEQIVYILNYNDVSATFFIDGKVIESNLLQMKALFYDKGSALGIFGYNYNYDRFSVKYVKSLLSNGFNYSNYCLYKNNTFIKSCAYYRINTIKPFSINNNLYSYIKNNKKSGSIYQIEVNSNTIKELNTTILYLKQKGYKIVTLDYLLRE